VLAAYIQLKEPVQEVIKMQNQQRTKCRIAYQAKPLSDYSKKVTSQPILCARHGKSQALEITSICSWIGTASPVSRSKNSR
jgi:hypothetical protein